MAPTNVCPHLVGYRGGTDSADGSLGDGDVRGGDGVNGAGGDGGTASNETNKMQNTTATGTVAGYSISREGITVHPGVHK